ncbi:RHO1 GDP-GTP exchange protein 2, partial [Rhizopus stolonifer]
PKQNEEKYKLYRKPIPLALLSLSFPDHTKRASTIIPLGRPSNVSSNASSDTNQSSNVSNTTSAAALQDKSGHPIAFVHLGKQSSGPMTLYAPTIAFRKQWADRIEGQRKTLVEKHNVFHVHATSERFFSSFDNKVNCIAVFDKGRSFVLGGDKGVYFKSEMNGNEPVRVLTMDKVSQIDVIQASNLILVLADKILYAYSLDTLRSNESGIKRGRKISSHVSFFKVGKICGSDGVEKTLVCFVRNNAMTSTIRALEPSETTEAKKKHKHFGHFIRSKNEALKVYKDLYIP